MAKRTLPANPPVSVFAVFIGLIYFLPPLKRFFALNGPSTLHLSHEESVSLTTYGWWHFHPPFHYLTDGISGDFQTYYNYLSDTLLNLLATITNLPPMVFQAAFYGPLLAVAFFVFNYWALCRVIPEWQKKYAWAPLIGALLMSLGGDSKLGSLLFPPEIENKLTAVIHVPFHAIALGTGQSLGWVFFFPTLALLFESARKRSRRISILAGVLLGLLMQVHTLTFMNVAFAHGVYLVLSVLKSTSRKAAMAASVGLIYMSLLIPNPNGTSRFGLLLVLHYCLAFSFSFADALKKPKGKWAELLSHYWIVYPVSFLVALPYLVRLVSFKQVPESLQVMTVTPFQLFIFYCVLIVSAVGSFLPLKNSGFARRALESLKISDEVFWGLAIFLGTLFLGFNDVWGWNNHPYRYFIHLLFPLSLLAALGLYHWRDRTPWVQKFLVAWLGLVALVNSIGYLSGSRFYVNFSTGSLEEARYFRTLERFAESTSTRRVGSYFLSPPLRTLDGILNPVMIVGHSNMRGFLPDPRYLKDQQRYQDRLRLFSVLFPVSEGSVDLDKKLVEGVEPPGGLPWRFVDPRIKNITPYIYGIETFGWVLPMDPELAEFFKSELARMHWVPVINSPHSTGHVLFKRGELHLDGVPEFSPRIPDSRGFKVEFVVQDAGRYSFYVGRPEGGLAAPLVDGEPVHLVKSHAEGSEWERELTQGKHVYFQETGPGSPDSTYFLAAVLKSRARAYLSWK